MVEGQHFVEEEQAGVGDAEFVFGQHGKFLNLADSIVCKKAYGASGEGGQSWQARWLVAGEGSPKHGEYVVFEPGDFAAFRDGDLASARDDALEWGKADEGVATNLFAAFDGLQEKALTLLPCGAEEGRHRRFKVGGEGAADGH
jgi:hypothetical protein